MKKGDLMFKIVPTLYQAKLDGEMAEAKLAELELNNTNRLLKDNVVSPNGGGRLQGQTGQGQGQGEPGGSRTELPPASRLPSTASTSIVSTNNWAA